MSSNAVEAPAQVPAPDYMPREWSPASSARDVALDLLRGLAMVILVVNHLVRRRFLFRIVPR